PGTYCPPRAATTWRNSKRRCSAGQKIFTAKHPAYSALLRYYMKEAVPTEAPKKEKDKKDKKDAAEEKPKAEGTGEAAEKKEGKVKFSVVAKDGKADREFEGPGAAGVNRTKWDLRWNPAAEPTAEQQEAVDGDGGDVPRGNHLV